MGKNYYEILGVSQDAGKDEIKRAYFRLVRQYNPEENPERFQEIREAYENLKDIDEFDKIILESPKDEIGQAQFRKIEQCMASRQYVRAKEMAEQALKTYGDIEGFLYYAGIAQRRTGQTGKSVKCFEKLHEMFPDKRIYAKELAISYWERGFTNKAIAAFNSTYALGERSLDFLMDYARCSFDRGRYDESITAIADGVELAMKNCTKYREELLNFFTQTAACSDMCRFTHESLDKIKGILRNFNNFIKRFASQMSDVYEALEYIFIMLAAGVDYRDPESREIISQLGDTYNDVFREETGEKRNYNLLIELLGVERDELLSDTLHRIGDSINGDAEYGQFIKLDMQLMVIEEWPEIETELKEFKKIYPTVYKYMTPMLNEVSRAFECGKLARLRKKLLKRYEYIEQYYDDGKYYEKYPENRPIKLAPAWDSNMKGTYVREGKKIGRNEPCPCGSGKKYKNCCGKNK